MADPKIIFKMALEELASGVIVVHNHPSGNLTASQSDIDLTKKTERSRKVPGGAIARSFDRGWAEIL